MVSTFLVSTVVTGVLLVGVALFVRGLRERHDKPEVEGSWLDALKVAMRSPKAWTAAYVLLILIASAATYGYIAGTPAVSESLASTSLLVLGGAFAAAILVFVAVGTYNAVRGHGRPSAQAAGMSLAAVGFVVLTAVAVKLVVA